MRPGRQSFPRWHLARAAAPEKPSAVIIPFPGPASPGIVTYPRALVVPQRRPEPALLTSRTLLGLGLAAAAACLLAVLVAVLV